MSTPPDCPEFACWQALLGDPLAPDQPERLEQHLKSCAACRERLDRAEEGEDALVRLARQVGDPTVAPADPALAQVVERLREVKAPDRAAPAEPADLYFLRPTDRPGLLGTLGDYEVLGVIGQGGMGVVLKALDPALHRLVAIKVMAAAVAGSATARRRFTREAQAAAAVCHDHVVAMHGVHECDGLPYLVMQYVAGESLQDRLDRVGPLEPVEVVRIGLQTAWGLAAAHAQGLIHRDIKPANLLLEDGLAKVKITDFGLARAVDDAALTQSGVIAGTPEYMAPEQARGEPLDHRADLFSLGSVLYTACTGRPPFRAANTLAVLKRICEDTPRPVREVNPEVPGWLGEIIARLHAKDRARRFQSAAEVAVLLGRHLTHLLGQYEAQAELLPPRPRGPRLSMPGLPRRLRLPALLLPALALVLLAALAPGMKSWLAGGPGAPGPKKEYLQEYYHSFKDNPEAREGVEVIGPDSDECVKFEPGGLRITLPAGYSGPPGFHGERPDTGVVIPTGVKGDFEITASFEILREPKPKDAGWPQTRLTLDVGVDRARNTVTTLSRRAEAGGTGFLAWVSVWNEEGGKNTSQYEVFPTGAKTGLLRLVRSGPVISYYAAEDADRHVTLLRQYPFSGEDLEDVRVVGSTGAGPRAALDVRVTEVRIRAASLTNVPGAGPRTAGGKGWLAVVLASVLATTFALGVLIALVRRRATGKMPLPPATEGRQAKPEAAAPPIAFPCPSCGRNLKAKAELAGKKLKCPRCGQVVAVAGPGGDDGVRTSL